MILLLLKSNKLLTPFAQEMAEEYIFTHTCFFTYQIELLQLYC
jgi:hypothetical protein